MAEKSFSSLKSKLDFLYGKKNLYLESILIESTEFCDQFNLLQEKDITSFFNKRNMIFNSLLTVNRTIESIILKINVDQKIYQRTRAKSSFLMQKIIEKDKVIIMKIKKNMQNLTHGLNKISKFESYIKP